MYDYIMRGIMRVNVVMERLGLTRPACGLIFVPARMRTEIIAIYYNKLFRDYLGVEKTIKLIIKNYYILNLR